MEDTQQELQAENTAGVENAEEAEVPMSKGRKAWEITKSVLVWVIVAVSAFMMIFTMVSSKTFNQPNKDVFGYKMFIVMSDSMKKTDFKAGDLVIVKQVDPTKLKEGDIITFYDPTDFSYKKTISHKIYSVTTDDDGDPGFKTYGTTTGEIDNWVVTYELIIGQYKTHIPNAGHFFNFMKTPAGYVVCILTPFLAMMIWQGVSLVTTYKKYKEEKNEEQTAAQTAALAAEREQVAKEREETQRMMDELNALKAMLLQQTQGGAPQNGTGQPPVTTPEEQGQDNGTENTQN
jgi:signal peptidase